MQILSCEYDGPVPGLTEPFLVLDIETEGLSHAHRVILIGLVLFPAQADDSSRARIVQLFDDDGASEHALLCALRDLLAAERSYRLVNFNGSSFDIPFLNARLRAREIDFQIAPELSVDLMRVARDRRTELGLESLSLKSVERALGIARSDTISGAESIALYRRFLALGDLDARDRVLLHNRDDIANLVPLTRILLPHHLPAVVAERFVVTKLRTMKHLLSAELICPYGAVPDLHYDRGGAALRAEDGRLHLRIPLRAARDPVSGRPLSVPDPAALFGRPAERLSDSEHAVLAGGDRSAWMSVFVDRVFAELCPTPPGTGSP